jgi:superfamily II DNA or RNA helicase
LTTAAEVRARIAHLVLGQANPESAVGGVSLEPHQISAVTRLEAALEEFGGGLLCDEVGMGKTFVATAIARHYARPLVVAPAALAEMWAQALALTRTAADFVSFETLSRRSTNGVPGSEKEQYDLVIIDEAHHARNRATRRYARLNQLTRIAKVLLLTATPIHNRLDEMSALLALFLGSRARSLTSSELARCTIRREHGQLQAGALIPTLLPLATLPIVDAPEIVRDLMSIPTPIPVREGGLAAALIGRGLVHQWASSEAALHHAVRKRLARAAALIASLEAGVYPTQQELRSWTFDDGVLQLGFAELLAAPIDDASALLESVKRHAHALREFRTAHSGDSSLDAHRADQLMQIRARHRGAKIVAFAQYAETVSMLYHKLAGAGGVAMLTAHGARVSGGKLSRREALARFAPGASRTAQPPVAERVDLLLATDLLSEGVNLQDAEIVVHLDLPWTNARMEQRVGRVARMGSTHPSVQAYLFRPPPSAAELLRSEKLVTQKWSIARQAVGSNSDAPIPDAGDRNDDGPPDSVLSKTEKLRTILESWIGNGASSKDVPVATVSSEESGFIAVVTVDGCMRLVVARSGPLSSDLDCQIEACRLAGGPDANSVNTDYDNPLRELRVWLERDRASVLAGDSGSSVIRRRKLLNRIDSAIEKAPPHSRINRMAVAALARKVVAAPHSAAIEAELEAFTDSSLSDDEWLAAIMGIESQTNLTNEETGNHSAPMALLVLRKDRNRVGKERDSNHLAST